MHPLRRLPALVCLFVAALSCRAADAPVAAAEEASWTATPAFVSQYMFRGVRLAGPCLQPGVEYGKGSWVAGLWSSAPLRSEDEASWEFDLYGSYTATLIPDRLELVPAATVYAYPKAHRSEGVYPATVEPSVALNYTVAGVRLTPKVYYDLMLEGTTGEFSAAFAYPLKDLGTELDFTAAVGTFLSRSVTAGADPKVKNWGDYWLAGVAVPIQVTANSSLTVGLTYAKGSDNHLKAGTEPKERNNLAVGRLAVSVSWAISL